ncbi:hypothetical protein [Nocardia altamirensis]|uniref:hypothetical protein n=1 Tax=Nocardia altamirensis TaxID=472158 RepID=UPI0008402F3B|nr:hypothetical protein [Nocardia altamirensis]
MAFNPTPYLLIDGERVECAATHADTAPLALDGITVDWGRSEYLSHARPATAQLSILDRTGTWAEKFATTTVIGRRIELWWEHPEAASLRWFAGRITAATATPSGPHGWVLAITAAARDADLGNVVMTTPGTWPTESMITRANRIAQAATPAEIDAFYIYPGVTEHPCSPLDVGDRDLHGLVDEMYMSAGDTYSYQPHTNVIRHLYRRNHDVAAYLVQMPDGLIYVQAGDIAYDGQTHKGTGLAGHHTSTDDGIQLAPNSVINRVQVNWKDTDGGDRTTFAVPADGDTHGRRTLQFDSWFDNDAHIEPLVTEVLNRAQYEGARPPHPPITWDTRRTSGFHTRTEAETFTLAAETQAVTYVSSSLYTAWLPQLWPVFAIIGGTITYDHGWIITTTLQHVWKTNPTPQVTWADLDKNLPWATGSPRQLSDAVSWNDLRYLTHSGVYPPS